MTREQVKVLRDESGVAGDLAQVAVCDRALAEGEGSDAWRECQRVIDAALAMQDS